MGERPLDVLDASLGEPVAVELKDGTVVTGDLGGYDQHMNLVLRDAVTAREAPADGGEAEDTREDTIVIRGDNVLSIRP